MQCTPALADEAIMRMVARWGAKGERAVRGALPPFMAVGGAADACYMWRRDGPLLQIRSEPSSG